MRDFLEKHEKTFGESIIKYKNGAPPRIVLSNDAGDVTETIRIDKWKSEHIAEYLSERMKTAISAN